jgi:septal ring factor EnvC (AmiA/AmiB activator)
MKNYLKYYFLLVLSVVFVTACGDLSQEAEKRLNELKNKTESLDSLINEEVDKVSALDSLINSESDKVKKLDSLINKSSSKLDSISKKGSKLLEIFNK